MSEIKSYKCDACEYDCERYGPGGWHINVISEYDGDVIRIDMCRACWARLKETEKRMSDAMILAHCKGQPREPVATEMSTATKEGEGV